MSTPTVKYTIIATILAALGGGSYYGYSCLESKANEINNQVEELAKTLPSEFKLKKINSESGLFGSSGTYKLTYINEINKNYNGELLINYEANHGLMTLFGENVTFTAKSEVKGSIAKALKVKTAGNVFSSFEGVITEDTLKMKETISNLSYILPSANPLDKGVSIKVKSVTSDFEFSKNTGKLSKSMNIPEIVGENLSYANSKFTIKNINIKYETNIKKPKHNKVGVKVSSLQLGTEDAKFSGLEFNSAIEEKNKKNQIKINAKVSRLNLLDWQNASIEFKSTLENISNDLVDVYNNLVPIYMAGHKVYEHKLFSKGMSNGLSFKLERLNLKHGEDQLEANGAYTISTTDKDKSFSLSKQSELNLSAEGNLHLLESLNPKDQSSENKLNIKDLNKVMIEYKNKSLRVNNNEATPELTLSVVDLLDQLGEENSLQIKSAEKTN